MATRRIRGVRLTREERLAVRRLISGGCSFEEAAATVRCSTKTVQRLLNMVGGMPPRPATRSTRQLSLAEREEVSRGLEAEHRIGRSRVVLAGRRPPCAARSTATVVPGGIGHVALTRPPTRRHVGPRPQSSAGVPGSAPRWKRC